MNPKPRSERLFSLDWHTLSSFLAHLKLQSFRLGAVAVARFQEDLLSLRATSLTYSTLLSLVPLLAVTFSVLKAFGIQNQLEPVLARMLEPLGAQGVEVSTRIIEFVNNIRVGVLGALGVAVLFYTVIALIGKIEESLNHIWRVRRSRRLSRKFSDYLSAVLVGPVLIFSAFALTASAQSHWLVQDILAIRPLGFMVVLATRIMPLVFLCAAFTFLYKFLPYTRVRLSSALVGGIVAGVLWQLAGAGFAAFVATSASQAAIYSSFAILIVFLIWLQVQWLIVLVGGEVAYFHQYPDAYLQETARKTPLFRERLALLALVEVTQHYLAGKPPWQPTALAATLRVPLSDIEEFIDTFVQRGILLRAIEPAGIALGRPPEQVTVVEIFDTLRGPQPAGPLREDEDDPIGHILRRREQALQQAFAGVTLRSLVAETRVSDSNLDTGVAQSAAS